MSETKLPNGTKALFYMGIHPRCFRPYEIAEVIGTCYDTANNRPALIVRYRDGTNDWNPLAVGNMGLLAAKDQLRSLGGSW